MAIVLSKKKSRIIAVPITVPGDMGDNVEGVIRVEYKKLSVKEYRNFLTEYRRLSDLVKDDVEAINEIDEFVDSVLMENVTNIFDIEDDNGDSVPFSKDVLEDYLNADYVRKALSEGFNAVQTNIELKEKNS